MKVIVEMIFNSDEDNIMCFSDVNAPYNYKPVEVAIQEVIKQRREHSHDLEVVRVKVADKDVTEEVKKYEKEYVQRRFEELDDQLPF